MANFINEVQEIRVARDWESIISDGLNAREEHDGSQWILGDLAQEVAKGYGEDTIGKYAGEIGIVKKTLMNYRTVSSKFTKEIRRKYHKLSYSHFVEASSLELPEAWLEKADDNDWSIEKLRHELHEALGDQKMAEPIPKVYKCPECGKWRLKDTSTYEICRGHYTTENGKYEYK